MEKPRFETTLDVEAIERRFAELWKETADEAPAVDHGAMLRARVANLMVFTHRDAQLDEVDRTIPEVTSSHPSRVLVIVGDREGEDRDIEFHVGTYCETNKAAVNANLSCEQAILKAYGQFVIELPSAVLPLLVSDLSTFLWWPQDIERGDDVFQKLTGASDRLIVDSLEFKDPVAGLREMYRLIEEEYVAHCGVSDLNWARLTFWRELLADFFDVPSYYKFLDHVTHVKIGYFAPEADARPSVQALLFMGWLASRLNWQHKQTVSIKSGSQTFRFLDDTKQTIEVTLSPVNHDNAKPGRLIEVTLESRADNPAVFKVSRSSDGLHLITEAEVGDEVRRGRVLPVRNRSLAQLIVREMEILCNDDIYREAIIAIAELTKPE